MRATQSNNLNAPDTGYDGDVNFVISELSRLDGGQTPFHDALVRPCSLHDESGASLWMNKAAADKLGVAEGATAKSTMELLEKIHVQDRVGIARFLADLPTSHSSGHKSGKSIEFRVLSSREGTQQARWIEGEKTPIEGQNSGRILTLITYHDVTAAKAAELKAASLKEESVQAEEAKSRFLANISHELRTPLNAILGFSELLNSPIAVSLGEEKRFEYIDLIHDSAKHLLNLLNSILDMSKLENGMYEIFPESFSIAKCLDSSAAIMTGQAAPRGISIEHNGFEELPNIVADERAVRQIMINLLSNAIKFSEDGGVVRVSAERLARNIEITIADEGVGISAEHLDSLGQPFFQADSKYDRKFEGTGLGLSIVKGLIELHGGSIRFASNRGQGTHVKVVLPVNCRTGKQVPVREPEGKLHKLQRPKPDGNPTPKILRNTA